ncbi:MAG: hypothetical protein ACRDHY_15490 [Anaerolineales bacterium]
MLSAAPPAFGVTVQDLVLEVRSARLGYASGERAQFELRVTNPTSETFRLGFGSSCQAFFVVEDPFRGILYDLRQHVGCLAIDTELVLEPGASEIYPFEWGFVDDFGRPVLSPQVYRIRVSLGYSEPLRTAATFAGLDMACSDRSDNDGDGLVDYPGDPGCLGELDSDEFDYFREVRVELVTDRQIYPPGERALIDILLTNVSDQPVTLTFPCNDVYEQIGFVVETPEGERVFTSGGGICLPALGSLILQPGITETFLYSWDFRDMSGSPVPYPSRWVLRSFVGSDEPVPKDSTSILLAPACADGVDNDLDGTTDFPDDRGCDAAAENDETGPLYLRMDGRGLSWDPVAEAKAYDIVTGDLRALRTSAGGFLEAMRGCLADDTQETALTIDGAPGARETWFFLGRTVHAGGNGSYDSGSPAQIGLRDPGINAATLSCP